MKPLGFSINALGRALHVPANHVSGIVNEKRGISAVMSLRLARYFGASAELWLALQQDYELDNAMDCHGPVNGKLVPNLMPFRF